MTKDQKLQPLEKVWVCPECQGEYHNDCSGSGHTMACSINVPLGEVKKTLASINVTDETGTRKFVPEPLEEVGEGNFEQLWQEFREAQKNNRPSYAKELLKNFIEMIKQQSYEAGRVAGIKECIEMIGKLPVPRPPDNKQNQIIRRLGDLLIKPYQND